MKIVFDHDGEASAFFNDQVVPLIRASGALAGSALGDQVLAIAEMLGRFHQEHFAVAYAAQTPAAVDLRRSAEYREERGGGGGRGAGGETNVAGNGQPAVSPARERRSHRRTGSAGA